MNTEPPTFGDLKAQRAIVFQKIMGPRGHRYPTIFLDYLDISELGNGTGNPFIYGNSCVYIPRAGERHLSKKEETFQMGSVSNCWIRKAILPRY